MVRIAVPFLAGQIFGHFGRTKQFAIFDIEGKKVVSNQLIAAGNESCTALAEFLRSKSVNVVICGGISADESNALSGAGIEYVANVQGNVRHAVEEYLMGTLQYNPVKYSGQYHYER